MVKITILLDGDKISPSIEGKLDYPTFLQIIGTLSLQTMNSLLDNAPQNHQSAIKGDIFDKFNFMATNVLEMFAPEFELNPDIQTEALLRHENEIVQEKYEKFIADPNNKAHLAEFKTAYKQTLKDLKPTTDDNA